MRIYDIIKRKRDGEELTEEEISFFTQSVTNGFASDEQTGAFLMAVYFNGMTRAETLALTNAMAKSGDSLDLSGWGGLAPTSTPQAESETKPRLRWLLLPPAAA